MRTEPRRNRTIGPLPGAGTRRRRACRFVLGAAVALALSCLGGGPALATDPAPDVAVSGGITAIGQVTTGGGADASLTGSLDVFVTVARRWGSFELYVEGNSTPREGGVAALVPEANGDAGSALDERDRGRLQVSELKLDLRLPGERSVAVGLVDLSAYLDATRISNDENLQFLSAPLINNPAIEFPDYTLGIVFRQPATGGVPAIHAAVTSSNGLADNPGKSYSELFDVGDDGKGVFAALEAAWKPGNRPVRVGVWWSGRDHDTLRGGSTERSNAGAWGSVGLILRRQALNLRLGAADPDVSAGDRFASLAYRLERDAMILGVAVAGLHASNEQPGAEDLVLFETYLSIELKRGMFLTPSFQHVWNRGFDPSREANRTSVFSLRFHKMF